MYKFNAIINNEEVISKQQLNIINPSDDSILGTVSSLSKEDIENAFLIAKNSQKKWAETPLDYKIQIITNFKNILLKNKEEIATLIMKEIAKGYNEALNEVIRTAEYIDSTIKEFNNIKPLVIDSNQHGIENKVGTFRYVPKGVGVAISPFNYPLNLSISKIIPAILTGNTIVFKPATQGSLTGVRLTQIAIEAGFPNGVLNVVTGRGSKIGDSIVMNKNADFISFTGSVEVGKRILEIASTKDIVLELGGKDAAIILDENNLIKISKEIVAGAFGYSGQRCTAIKRVITTNEIADNLVPLLKEEISKLTIGMPEQNCNITPLIDNKSARFVKELIEDSINKRGKLIVGGKYENNIVFPTLIDNVTTDMRIAWEEPFGPVLPIIRVNTEEEMIKVNNESNFGLQASVYSQDIDKAICIAEKLEVGTVNINGKSQRSPDIFPFLGIKDSGFGVQGIRESLLSSVRYKGIVINK